MESVEPIASFASRRPPGGFVTVGAHGGGSATRPPLDALLRQLEHVGDLDAYFEPSAPVDDGVDADGSLREQMLRSVRRIARSDVLERAAALGRETLEMSDEVVTLQGQVQREMERQRELEQIMQERQAVAVSAALGQLSDVVVSAENSSSNDNGGGGGGGASVVMTEEEAVAIVQQAFHQIPARMRAEERERERLEAATVATRPLPARAGGLVPPTVTPATVPTTPATTVPNTPEAVSPEAGPTPESTPRGGRGA